MKKLIKRTHFAIYTLLCAVLAFGCVRQETKVITEVVYDTIYIEKTTVIDNNVRAGQIWVKEYDCDNPFEECKRDTVYIIEVRGEYAKYKRHGRIMSEDVYWIPVNARRIK
jgi:hypothetical protein